MTPTPNLGDALDALPINSRPQAVIGAGQARYRSADDSDWLVELADECDAVWDRLSLDGWRAAITDLAWWVRQRRGDDGNAGKTPGTSAGGTPSPPYFIQLFVAQSLRFDFRFDELHDYLRRASDLDALLQSLRIFARLGAGYLVPKEEVERVRLLADCDVKSLHCLTHGMCMAPDSKPWARDIVDISLEIQRRDPSPNPVLAYRLGIGYRLLGDLDAADRQLRIAMSVPPPDNSVHQQFHTELTSIDLARDFRATLRQQQEDFETRLSRVREETLEEIHKSLRDGLTANFQILAIFLTLAAFLGTAGATVVRLAESEISWARGILTLLVLVVFTFLVFVGSRVLLAMQTPRWVRRSRPTP